MNALEHRGESGGSARQGKGAVMWICGRVLRTGASPAGRVDKPVDNADALPTASPTLSRLSPTSSTGPTTSDSKRLPLTALRFNICVPLNPIPTSPTRWLTLSRSGSFPYLITTQAKRNLSSRSGSRRGAQRHVDQSGDDVGQVEAPIEPVLELRQISLGILGANRMVGAAQRRLDVAENRVHPSKLGTLDRGFPPPVTIGS